MAEPDADDSSSSTSSSAPKESWLGPKGSRKRTGLQIGIGVLGLLIAFLVYRSNRASAAAAQQAANTSSAGYTYPVSGPSGGVTSGDGGTAAGGTGATTGGSDDSAVADALGTLGQNDAQGFAQLLAGVQQSDQDTQTGLQQIDTDTQTGLGQVDTDTQNGLAQLGQGLQTINTTQLQEAGVLGTLTKTLKTITRKLTNVQKTVNKDNRKINKQQQTIKTLRRQINGHKPAASGPHSGAKLQPISHMGLASISTSSSAHLNSISRVVPTLGTVTYAPGADTRIGGHATINKYTG